MVKKSPARPITVTGTELNMFKLAPATGARKKNLVPEKYDTLASF